MKVLELKGFKALRAFNAFHALLFGLKMLPAHQAESYEDFYSRLQDLPLKEQETLLRTAACFVELDEAEVAAMLCFVCDKNGVPYTEENLKNLSPDQIVDIIVAVSLKIAEIKIDLLNETEKKN